MIAGVQNLLDDADLLPELLVGIGMIGIDDAGGVTDLALVVELVEQCQILIVIVGDRLSVLVCGAAQDHMSERIAAGPYLISAIGEIVRTLGRVDRI